MWAGRRPTIAKDLGISSGTNSEVVMNTIVIEKSPGSIIDEIIEIGNKIDALYEADGGRSAWVCVPKEIAAAWRGEGKDEADQEEEL